MKIIGLSVVLGIVLFFSAPAHAKNELMLSKEQLFDGGPALDNHRFRDDCSELFYVDKGENIEDMRRDFPYYWCQGMYTLTLDGPPGTTVTLFGSYYYGQERGYLVLKKTDNEKVWILHLEEFPSGRWSSVQPSRQSGGYEAFFIPAPNFRRNVSSVQWGQWWVGDFPTNGPAN